MSHDNHTAEAGGGRERTLAALRTLGQATAAQVAERAGLGYSTVTAHLRALHDDGAAEPVHGEDRRAYWRPTGAPTATPAPAPAPDGGSGQATAADATPGDTVPTGPDTGDASTPPAGPPARQPAEPSTEPDTTATAAGVGTPAQGGVDRPDRNRRRSGGLRQEVLAVLQDHPDEQFTPHHLAKKLNASAGAVANAAHKLVQEGSARQVNEAPTRFQAE